MGQSKVEVGIVDYGIGNISSLVNALDRKRIRTLVSFNPRELDEVNTIILPGVGAFPEAMKVLEKHNLRSFLTKFVKKRVIVGVCLGAQILATRSHESDQNTDGLNLIPGQITKMSGNQFHIGWNTVIWSKKMAGFRQYDKSNYYFNHSLVYNGCSENIWAYSEVKKGYKIPAIIKCGNAIGLQFHPEKSYELGRKLLCDIVCGRSLA